MSTSAWHPIRLRLASLLGLVLLFYSATPHVHEAHGVPGFRGAHAGAHAGVEAAERFERASAQAARLLADDAHESHSPQSSSDNHPCTLCRNESASATALPPEPFARLSAPAQERFVLAENPSVAGRLDATRPPPRAPPCA